MYMYICVYICESVSPKQLKLIHNQLWCLSVPLIILSSVYISWILLHRENNRHVESWNAASLLLRAKLQKISTENWHSAQTKLALSAACASVWIQWVWVWEGCLPTWYHAVCSQCDISSWARKYHSCSCLTLISHLLHSLAITSSSPHQQHTHIMYWLLWCNWLFVFFCHVWSANWLAVLVYLNEIKCAARVSLKVQVQMYHGVF